MTNIQNFSLVYRSKANIDVRIFCGKTTHLFGPKNKENAGKGFCGNVNSAFDFGP